MECWLPTHVRWDVDFGGRVGRSKRVARQIREIAPEFVELRFDGDRGISELSAIFAEIHKDHPRVEATVRLTPRATEAAHWGYPIRFLWTVDPGVPFRRCIPTDAHAISFSPDEATVHLLPDLLEEFADSSVEELHLRNVAAVPALASKGYIPTPRLDQIRELSEPISSASPSVNGKRLVVHDAFLCRMLEGLFPDGTGAKVEFSGCPAASRLAYVDWDGNVYPCDSLPIRLGNLHESSFERIWRSPERVRVVESILEISSAGESSRSGVGTFGGCRGLADLRSASLGAAVYSREGGGSGEHRDRKQGNRE